jgi:hypothetical protein
MKSTGESRFFFACDLAVTLIAEHERILKQSPISHRLATESKIRVF